MSDNVEINELNDHNATSTPEHYEGNSHQHVEENHDETQMDERTHRDSNKEENYRKVFIGGLSWETNQDSLKSYFSKYGEVTDCLIMKDKATGRSRGFGFVIYATREAADKCVSDDRHNVDGRSIEAKHSVPRDEMTRGPKTKKIFVGGLAINTSEADFRRHFEQYGPITDAQIMIDRETGRSRGFGFITYDSEATVEKVITLKHDISGKLVDVKKAEPKKPMGPLHYGHGDYYNGGYAMHGPGSYPPPPFFGYSGPPPPYYGGGGHSSSHHLSSNHGGGSSRQLPPTGSPTNSRHARALGGYSGGGGAGNSRHSSHHGGGGGYGGYSGYGYGDPYYGGYGSGYGPYSGSYRSQRSERFYHPYR